MLFRSGDRKSAPGTARTVAIDMNNDLALLEVQPGGPTPAKSFRVANPSKLETAMKVYAIGHPRGVPWAFTEGVVSALIPDYDYMYDDGVKRHAVRVILTQTPIDPGNSGGALLDAEGELVGVTSMGRPKDRIATVAIACDPIASFIEAGMRGESPPPPREAADRKSTRLNSSHIPLSRMPSSA